ncbi:hypothetical protein D3C77_697150 [compost metagenome]
MKGRVTLRSVAGQSACTQVFEQATIEAFQVRQLKVVPAGSAASVTKQVVNFGTAALSHVLIHGRIVGCGSLDHPFHFLAEPLRRFGLAATP